VKWVKGLNMEGKERFDFPASVQVFYGGRFVPFQPTVHLRLFPSFLVNFFFRIFMSGSNGRVVYRRQNNIDWAFVMWFFSFFLFVSTSVLLMS